MREWTLDMDDACDILERKLSVRLSPVFADLWPFGLMPSAPCANFRSVCLPSVQTFWINALGALPRGLCATSPHPHRPIGVTKDLKVAMGTCALVLAYRKVGGRLQSV